MCYYDLMLDLPLCRWYLMNCWKEPGKRRRKKPGSVNVLRMIFSFYYSLLRFVSLSQLTFFVLDG
jgi:hypothetical protein